MLLISSMSSIDMLYEAIEFLAVSKGGDSPDPRKELTKLPNILLWELLSSVLFVIYGVTGVSVLLEESLLNMPRPKKL